MGDGGTDDDPERITLEQFFIACAVQLGKTQVEFARGYYVVDLFDVIDAVGKSEAQRMLAQIPIDNLANYAAEEQQRILAELRKQAGIKAQSSKFDQAQFDAMKLRLKLGV